MANLRGLALVVKPLSNVHAVLAFDKPCTRSRRPRPERGSPRRSRVHGSAATAWSSRRAPSSGYRLYDEAAIERLRTMRLLVEDGWTASAAARAVADGTAPPVALSGAGRAAGAIVSGDPIEAFVSAAAALDGDRIEAALDELFGRGSFESIVDAWLMPAAAALGDAWAAGRVTVAGEHAASAALGRRLAGAFEAAARVDARPVVVGLPPGSRHELGALAFATALRRRGVAVLYIGADVPVASWLDVRARLQPRLLVVAVVTADDRRGGGRRGDSAPARRPRDAGRIRGSSRRRRSERGGRLRWSCPIRSSPPRIARWHCSRPDGLRPGIMVRPP